jgi:hypothetical protein
MTRLLVGPMHANAANLNGYDLLAKGLCHYREVYVTRT